jgi:hypothetical protein
MLVGKHEQEMHMGSLGRGGKITLKTDFQKDIMQGCRTNTSEKGTMVGLLNTKTKAIFHCPRISFATFVPNFIPLLTKLSPKMAVHGPKTRSGIITKQ